MPVAATWNEPSRRAPRVAPRRDAWGLYLLLIVALVPIVVPKGPGQSAIVDLFNLVAIPAFAVSLLMARRSLVVPFLVPVFLIGVASLVATLNAESPGTALFAMLQDTYLFVWFVVVVNVLRDRRDGTSFRAAWMWVANAVALWALFTLMTHGQSIADLARPKGMRALATFSNPNMFADYLVVSIFIVLSLGEEAGRLVRFGSLALLFTALVATKSNGGLMALGAGLAVWMLARAWTMRLPATALLALGLLGGSLALGGVWLVKGMGVGSAELGQFESESLLRRVAHSSEDRARIWGNLLRTYARRPVGIGPGNSALLELSVEQRVRRESLLSKEAHNDYLGYLVERGPLGLLGLLALKVEAFYWIGRWWGQRRKQGQRSGGALAAAAIGGLVATSMHSFTIEMLHFRHAWLFLAVVCALDGMVFRWGRTARAGGVAVEPDLPEAAVA